MPARPLSDTTLHLIDAVREALAGCDDVQEKRMFGCHVFMVNGKLCLGVEDDELLVRLPPSQHAAVAETPGLRPLSSKGQMDGYFFIGPAAYATRQQWQHWIAQALAFNPHAKATPPKSARPRPANPRPPTQRHRRRPRPGRAPHTQAPHLRRRISPFAGEPHAHPHRPARQPRHTDEGLRIGTVRRPPRGVPKAEFASRDYYDVWYPELSPQPDTMHTALESHRLQDHGQQAEADKLWQQFVRKFRKEMAEPAASRTLDLLAALSQHSAFAIGCYCEQEARCHRGILRSLLKERGADIANGDKDTGDMDPGEKYTGDTGH